MTRPDPDTLLARVQAEEQPKGRLKIFFGASAGVGKTYTMLEEAHQKLAEGVDVLIGYVETHRRAETEALVVGLPALPRRQIPYSGTVLEEFDLDAALERHPQLILVDELAHTNAPGSRHARRWQDVVELLAAGISVYTAVNVQHIESLNDVVAQITGVIVRETVPDSILERADALELVDLTPDDLLQRLREGKVYLPQQAERATQHFFRQGNLHALRELALRRTADRVDAQMQGYKRDHAIAEPWPTSERLLVCIGPGPLSGRLVRAARRMAGRLRAPWIVAHVETPAELGRPDLFRDQVAQTLRLAEQLGAETITLSAQNVSEAVLLYARQRNVTKIVVGKPARPRWQELIFGSVVDDLVRRSGVIDVYVLSGDFGDTEPPVSPLLTPTSGQGDYGRGVLTVALCTGVAALMFPYLDLSNLVMVYLVGIVIVASRNGRGPAVLASLLSVAAFDFFFVPPYLTFAVSDVQYIATFAVMLLVAFVISSLTVRNRLQAEAARQRERRTAALYALSRELAATRDMDGLLRAAVRHVSEIFSSQVVLLLPHGTRLQPWGGVAGWWGADVNSSMVFAPNSSDQGVAQWVFDHRQAAGLGTNTLPSAEAVYLPLIASARTTGVIGVRPTAERRPFNPEQMHLLETFASQIALALERSDLAQQAQQARVQVETERLRSSLLSSVSHDLRTPLATIIGATSSLLEDGQLEGARHELAQDAHDEAQRLSHLVNNLLEVTRLESGSVQLRKTWQPLEEVVGAVLDRLEEPLQRHPVEISLPPDLPLVPFDDLLIEQVLMNLLENGAKYAPADTPISIRAWATPADVLVEVADRGPGVPPGDEERVFEKFYRAAAPGMRGVGLGLAICHAIVKTHGGRIWVEQREGGGAAFRFTLPREGAPPRVTSDQVTR